MYVENTDVQRVILHAKPGVDYGAAIRDGLSVAISEWVNVTVWHNGREFEIYVNDLIASVRKKSE